MVPVVKITYGYPQHSRNPSEVGSRPGNHHSEKNQFTVPLTPKMQTLPGPADAGTHKLDQAWEHNATV